MSAPEIHIFKLEATSSLTPGDIEAIKNGIKVYLRSHLISGCITHSTDPVCPGGAPGMGLVDIPTPDAPTIHLVLGERGAGMSHRDLGQLAAKYKETRTGADPAPHLQAEQQYEENNGGGK